jgi:5'-nucleotidase
MLYMAMLSGDLDVLVDMDGVLADFDRGVEQILCADYPYIELVRPRREFYISADYGEYEGVVRAISDRLGFFQELDVIRGAVRGWERILEAGYNPRVCSSPLTSHPACIEEKRAWLEEHLVPDFGYSVIDLAIFDKDKSRHHGVALVDDHPAPKGAERASWTHIAFDATYNRAAQTDLRLEGWEDMGLEALLKRARQRRLVG